MPRFHRPPSGRRQPRTTAKAIALGMTLAGHVSRGDIRACLIPVRLPLENREGYRKRFAADRPLAIHAFWGGPRVCNVRVSDAQRIQLGQVDYSLVRELGYVRLDAFQIAWTWEHDREWCANAHAAMETGEREREDAPELERFQRRHAHREVWVIRFAVDHTETPRMLAQAGRDRASFVEGPDHRWRYRPGTEDAETDRGYTSVDSLSVRDAGRALTDEQHELHIARPARDREARRQAMLAATRAALSTEQRVTAARRAAASKGLDMRSEFRLYDRHVRLERVVEALRQLELIESRVFPQRRAA